MKLRITKMLALTVLAFVVIIITSSGKGKAAEKAVAPTEYKKVKNIFKIVVEGNVDLYITQGIEENLKVYDRKQADVQLNNGVLQISSFRKERLAVAVTIKNLSAIEASGTAKVRSMNEISTVNLEIQLDGHADAKIEAQAISISSYLSGQAKLELSGESENQHLGLSGAAQYEASRFAAQTRSMTVSQGAVASIKQEGQNTIVQSLTNVPEKVNTLIVDHRL
jgi:osmotically-inducible protein OsmY